MTTKVTILNNGPKAVKVEVQGRDENGHFRQVDEKQIEPFQFGEVYVHGTQSFQVQEVKED